MIWKFIQKLFGKKDSSSGPVPSLPSLPSASIASSKSGPSDQKKIKKTPIEKLVAIALSQVGVKEVGGNNNGPQIREYQTATNLKPASWAWCSAFCCWVIREWLKDPEVVEWLNLGSVSIEWWRPKTAAAFGFMEWAKNRPTTTKILSNKAKPQAGDFAVFDFSHIGIVTKVLSDGRFQAVEGNTGPAGLRDSESGDGVWLKTRSPSLVRAFVRIQPK